jgi:16S rRNA (cytosine967-C5)-methyltransferase
MIPSARLSAAIEVLDDVFARRRPASDALKDWGLAHRFAGSGDRAAIAALVYDALRRKASSAYLMGAETSRALILGMLKLERHLESDAIAALCNGERFAPEPLSADEKRALNNAHAFDDAPAYVVGDYPEWLDTQFEATFGEGRADELSHLAHRAPLDLRVNLLKATPELAYEELKHLHVERATLSPVGLRIQLTAEGKQPSVQSEPAFLKGQVEIQDEGSQLVAQLASVDPGMQVIDLCAGGGGKSLALASLMDNRGQIFATDSDKRRLAPIFDRLTRAGARNVQVRAPKGKEDEPLAGLERRADVVLVDAPCTGTGTWRRNPDAKWRLRPNALDERVKEQAIVLDRAARFVKSGGHIAYITCSLLERENDDAIESFLARHNGYAVKPPHEVALAAGLPQLQDCVSPRGKGLLLTPKRCGTDGFFISILVSP